MDQKHKFNIGDVVLIQVRSDLVGRDTWVGHIVGLDKTSYAVKTLSTEAAFLTKIPFLFDKLISKIELEDVARTIKMVKLLYYE